MCDEYFSLSKHLIENPNSANVQQSIVSPVPKFHDDLTVNESGIIVLPKQVFGCLWEKEKLSARDISFNTDIISKSQRWVYPKICYEPRI